MRKYIERIFLILCIAVMIPFRVSAAEQGNIQLKVKEKKAEVTLTLPKSVGKNVLSLQMAMKIESTAQEKTKIEFQFPDNVAKIAVYRYNETTGILNLYLSGTESLFREGKNSIILGNMQISTSDKNGVTVKVGVIEDSAKTVEGMKTNVISNIEYPEEVEIVLGNGGIPDDGDQDDGDQDDGDQDDGDQDDGNQDDGNQDDGDQDDGDQDDEEDDQGNTEITPDKKELQKIIKEAKMYKRSEYTRESYEALQKEIANAEIVFEKEDASKEEIAEAIKAVENAIGALVRKQETSVPNIEEDHRGEQDSSPDSGNGPNGTEDTVKTGDDSAILPFVIALVFSVGVIALIVIRKIYHKFK